MGLVLCLGCIRFMDRPHVRHKERTPNVLNNFTHIERRCGREDLN